MNDTTNIAWRFTTVVPFDCDDDDYDDYGWYFIVPTNKMTMMMIVMLTMMNDVSWVVC